MGKSVIIVLFYIGFGFLDSCNGLPIDFTTVGTGKLNAIWLTSSLLLAIGFFIGIVSLIIGCICCRNGRGFQEFSNSHGCLTAPVVDGFVNPTASSEITIFPPFGFNSDTSNRSSVVQFEPLPNIKPQAPNLRPAAFSYSEQEISSQDWFFNPYNNFPRNQLKYLQEYGKGWFGCVVEGEAQGIVPNEKVTKVIVKILHEDATATDQMYFLHEVKFYRDLKHPNVLRLLGRCLETEPFLILLESCPNGDLKSFLTQNMASAQALVEQGVTLRMCSNITSGLQFMHENKFIHTDLAARNCLVSPDLTVKIGDYGNSIEVFKSDYYCAGSVALPVRWCAPETLKCTDVTIETREVTPLANIWTLAIVFWEICEFCKLPYEELNDDQVIVRVLGEKNYFLQTPKMLCLYKDELYHLMKLCWSPPLQRPTAAQIGVILSNLLSSKTATNQECGDSNRLSQDFEQRWQNSKPNFIPKTDNACEADDKTLSTVNITKFRGAKVADSSYMDSPLGIFMSNKSKGQESSRFTLTGDGYKSEKATIQLSDSEISETKSVNDKKDDEFLGVKKSASITNLTGSLDRLNTVAQELRNNEFKANFELNTEFETPEDFTNDPKGPNHEIDSWLKGVEVNNEEDETFVRKISEAIRDLDAALAMEKTSSSEETSGKSSHQSSPGKETKETEDAVIVDFKLGGDTTSLMNVIPKSFELSSLQNSEEPQSLNFTNAVTDKRSDCGNGAVFGNYEQNRSINPDPKNSPKLKSMVFDESLKGNDSFFNIQSRNSSDTEDEIWRRRIERGEFSEKVKEKSKSIANLMVLTHIDASDDSDVDLDRSLDRSLIRNSYSRRNFSNAKTSLSSNNFGSENDVTNAVLEDTFKASLIKLSNDHKEYGHFDSLGMILPTAVDRQNLWGNILRKSSSEENLISAMCSFPIQSSLPMKVEDAKMVTDPSEVLENNSSYENKTNSRNNFLGNTASKILGNDVTISDDNFQNSASIDYFKTNKVEVNVESETEYNQKLDVCDNSENEIQCEKNYFSGSSPVTVDWQTKGHVDNEPNYDLPGVIKEVNNVSVLLNEESPAASVPSATEESNLIKNNFEDTILKRGERLTPAIVPIFFGAEKLLPASPDMTGGESLLTLEPNQGIENAPEESNKNLYVIPEIRIIEEELDPFIEDQVTDTMFKLEKIRPFKFILKDEETSLSQSKSPSDEGSEQLKIEDHNIDHNKISDITQRDIVEDTFDKKSADCNGILVNEKLVEPNTPDTTSEGVEVIIGACEDYTLDYFNGLKTTFGGVENEKNEKILQNYPEVIINKEVNLDVWDKLLEKSITQIFDSTNFGDVSFFDSSLESSARDPYSDLQVLASDTSVSTSLTTSLSNVDLDEKEKKTEDPLNSNGFTNLNGNASEEEYENGKLRTPDDERSSDSGFRDKGSLSESVEDACEGKYNLEDIEAELEEAYVKGAFNNCHLEKEKCPPKEQSVPFDYTEDDNKNEDDFSDIEGEVDFWQNQENSEYYPEISEFNPTNSNGWYPHPPDENFFVSHENVDEEFVNALRNELRQKLPIQSRSFHEFSEDFDGRCCESSEEDKKYVTNFSVPLSPILEEQDHSSSDCPEQVYFPMQESMIQKGRKNITNLMETGKTVDTNSFIHYLDYMVETEGKDKHFNRLFPEDDLSSCDTIRLGGNISVEKKDPKSSDVLLVNMETNEIKLLKTLDSPRRVNGEVERGDILDNDKDSPYDEGLIFTPESGTPEKDRSLSEPSRSSNGSRVGDASSEVTISSPDVLSDYYLTPNSEKSPNDSPQHLTTLSSNKNDPLIEHKDINEPQKNNFTSSVIKGEACLPSNSNIHLLEEDHLVLEPYENYNEIYVSKEEGVYEMSTSFMGEGSDNEDAIESGQKVQDDNDKDADNFNANSNDWESLSSGAEEDLSSSSGEFIWKDGEKESMVKVKRISDNGDEEALFEDSKSEWNEKLFQDKKHDDKIIEANDEMKYNETEDIFNDEDQDGNPDYSDSEDDRDCSSTGSSASITDFVPSAWNSKATPSRPALRSPDKKTENQKRNVWFKKQKYHCIYEYPREPSDTESAENSPQKHFTYGINSSDVSNKYSLYGINSKMNLSNKYFTYGLSDLIDYSNYVDWEALEGVESDTVPENTVLKDGIKAVDNSSGPYDGNFCNMNSFDYDFNGSSMTNDEFFVSSSARPFQVGSSQFFPSSGRFPIFNNFQNNSTEVEYDDDDCPHDVDSRDFITPDSGVDTDTTPQKKSDDENESKSDEERSGDIVNIFDNLKFSFMGKSPEANNKSASDAFGEDSCSSNEISIPNSISPPSPVALGELRHTRDKLKLDLPLNHNIDLNMSVGKNMHKVEELTQN